MTFVASGQEVEKRWSCSHLRDSPCAKAPLIRRYLKVAVTSENFLGAPVLGPNLAKGNDTWRLKYLK